MANDTDDILIEAIESDDFDAVKAILLEGKVTPMTLGDALFIAVLHDKEAIVAALLDAGASVDRANSCTPLSLNFITDNAHVLKMIEDEEKRQEDVANLYRLQSEFKKAGLVLSVDETKTAFHVVQQFASLTLKR